VKCRRGRHFTGMKSPGGDFFPVLGGRSYNGTPAVCIDTLLTVWFANANNN